MTTPDHRRYIPDPQTLDDFTPPDGDRWTAQRREDGGWATVAPANDPTATYDRYSHVRRPDGRNTIPFADPRAAEDVAAEANGER